MDRATIVETQIFLLLYILPLLQYNFFMENNFYQNNITIVPVPDTPFKIKTQNSSFFIGSCFAENLYKMFDKLHLNSFISPFGNIYNPKSLGNSLTRLIETKLIRDSECIKIDGIYQHFDFHSKTGSKSLPGFVENTNRLITKSSKELLDCDLLIITLGTAYVFEKEDRVVNNCHKLPKDSFIRRVLTVDEITESLFKPLKKLKALNAKLNIVLTLSPVRHLRDNPSENSYSKAILRVAIEELLQKTNAYYFPSYEILLDELRDYRWYDDSLTHPNRSAVEYIMNRFLEVSETDSLKDYIKRVTKLNTMLNHRIINIDSESTNKFILKTQRTLEMIKKEYKYLIKLQSVKSSQYLESVE